MHKLNRNEFRETTDPEGSKPPSFSARSEHFYGVAVFIDVHKRQLRLKFPVINILMNKSFARGRYVVSARFTMVLREDNWKFKTMFSRVIIE